MAYLDDVIIFSASEEEHLGDDILAKDQKSVNEVSSFNEHTKESQVDLNASYFRHIIKFKGFKM